MSEYKRGVDSLPLTLPEIPMPRDPDCACSDLDGETDTFGTHYFSCPQRARTERCFPKDSDPNYVHITRRNWLEIIRRFDSNGMSPPEDSLGRKLFYTEQESDWRENADD